MAKMCSFWDYSNGKSPFLMGKSTIIGDIMGLYLFMNLYIYMDMSGNVGYTTNDS